MMQLNLKFFNIFQRIRINTEYKILMEKMELGPETICIRLIGSCSLDTWLNKFKVNARLQLLFRLKAHGAYLINEVFSGVRWRIFGCMFVELLCNFFQKCNFLTFRTLLGNTLDHTVKYIRSTKTPLWQAMKHKFFR